ncbi:DMT family transporter [Breoghania sp.]|uniref:DMT family transporter n=1 Tax=Breoghania sp. TaxID=2065378 RepID=UPI0029CA4FE8|nr:DMT family transporter [Breoghania sp.]
MSEAQARARAETTGDETQSALPADTGQPLYAAAWMFLALLSFSAMAVAGRELVGHLDTFSIMFYRSLIGFAVVASVLAVTGKFGQVKTRRIGTHFWRNVAHFTGQNLWFFAVGYITLAQLFALEFTSPIWVALAAPFFLGERFTGWRIGTTIAGFIGVLIVVRPGVTEVGIGEVTALASSVCFASNIMITKSLSRTETTLGIVFWMTLMQAVMAGVILLGQPIVPDWQVVPWVVVVGFGGLSAHFSLARAFRHADASVVAPMDFLRLPLIAFVGALAYAEALDPYVFIGGAIVFFSNYVNVWRAGRKAA